MNRLLFFLILFFSPFVLSDGVIGNTQPGLAGGDTTDPIGNGALQGSIAESTNAADYGFPELIRCDFADGYRFVLQLEFLSVNPKQKCAFVFMRGYVCSDPDVDLVNTIRYWVPTGPVYGANTRLRMIFNLDGSVYSIEDSTGVANTCSGVSNISELVSRGHTG